MKRKYTVNPLSHLTGVSLRTLHYYDEIGLLRPESRSEAGYRFYGDHELLLLQQILFYRELDVPLNEIKKIIYDPKFNKTKALNKHKQLLQKKIDRLRRLTITIDKTLMHIKGEKQMLSDKELYIGFSAEQANRYAKEARHLYGEEIVGKTERRIRKLSKEKWAEIRHEGEIIAQELAMVAGKDAADPEVQKLIKRHHAWIENFYEAPRELYAGLGLLYTQNPEFREYYDKYHSGLADFIKTAIDYFCCNSLK